MEFTSPDAERHYADLVRATPTTVAAFDFDGTLSPIVEDPAAARIHPDLPEALSDLAAQVRAIAVITGRPVRQALALGDLEELGARLDGQGRDLYVLGQYGNERWSSLDRRVVSPRPPHGLSGFLRDLPSALRGADAAEAYVEEKGLAIAVHTRRLDDPEGTFERLQEPLSDLARHHELTVEPGRHVIEVRAAGMDKGVAVRRLAQEVGAEGFLFAGDDLGDLEAFRAVESLREEGLATLLVCSASAEQSALLDLADVVVEGPDGVLDLVRELAADAAAIRA